MKRDRIIKLRNKFSVADIYYSLSTWQEKEIDGVRFVPVVKTPPQENMKYNVHFMRKDSLELLK